MAGFLSNLKKRILQQKFAICTRQLEADLAPFDSYLLIRGIKTLPIRMERQQENALTIAKWLQTQKRLSRFTTLVWRIIQDMKSIRNQARGFGSMIALVLKIIFSKKILENVQLITYAESLGGVESLITYPMIQTHGDVPAEIRAKLGITDNFLRLSVGIENIDDLLADLRQAFGDNDEI